MNKVILFLIFFTKAVAIVNAQSNFWNSADAYLAQTPPGDTPKVFAPELLVKDSGIAMDRSAFSPDGKEFYYCYAQHWFDAKGNKIKYFKYADNKWNGPFVLNQGHYAPTFSADENTIYFIGGGKGMVFQSHRTDTGWSPEEVYLKRNYGLYDFMPTFSGKIYVASNINGNINDYTSYDICLLPSSDKDTMAQTLGTPLNTPGFNGDFFIAPDESYIVISANETKDYECELHISFHKKDGTWTKPVSLGPLINDGIAHRWGEYVTPDNKYLFYSKGTSEKDCHIYWVRFDELLQKLKAKAQI
jgi:hypothetical protein